MMTLDKKMISCRPAPPLLVLCGALLLAPPRRRALARARPTAARPSSWPRAAAAGCQPRLRGRAHPLAPARAARGFAVVRMRRTVRGAPAFARASRALRA